MKFYYQLPNRASRVNRVQCACSNDYAICKDLGLSSTYNTRSFFACNKTTLTSVSCAPIIQPEAIRGCMQKKKNKKKQLPLTSTVYELKATKTLYQLSITSRQCTSYRQQVHCSSYQSVESLMMVIRPLLVLPIANSNVIV